MSIDEKRKIIEVTRAAGGRVPSFTGLGGQIHDNVRKEMFAVYEETATPKFLDPKAAQLLSEGRDNFHRYRLDQRALVESGSDTLFFLWLGDRITDTIAVELRARGFSVMNEGIMLHVSDVKPDQLRQHLKEIVSQGAPDPVALSRSVANKLREKYDAFLPEELLCEDYGRSRLDAEGAWRTLSHIAGSGQQERAAQS